MLKKYWKLWCKIVDKRNEGIDYSCYEEHWSYTMPLMALYIPTIIVTFANLIVFAHDFALMPINITIGFWLIAFTLTSIWLVWHFRFYYPKNKN